MRIAYQGELHSYSSLAVAELFPNDEAIGLESFEACFDALDSGDVDRLVLPVSNTSTGEIKAVVERLENYEQVAETTLPVGHALLVVPGTDLSLIRRVFSHPVALDQAARYLADRNWLAVPTTDTAGAAREVAEAGDPTVAALASPRAAAYGLEVAATGVVDHESNATHFVALQRST